MASLNMGISHPLTQENINRLVGIGIGNYAFGTFRRPPNGQNKKFFIKYVGRSDTNLRTEIIQQGITLKIKADGSPKYTHFKFTHDAVTPKDAFLLECAAFHDFGGSQKLDNQIHPARPAGFTKDTLPWSKLTCKD